MDSKTAQLITLNLQAPIAALALNDPGKRNALGLAMFDALDAALVEIKARDDVHILRLSGEGPAFCAGFDLAAAQRQPELIGVYINRLSTALRALRRLPQVVVAQVHGHAIAGGCAILSACDFVYTAPDATLGYPVHRLGVSPAVTIPTLARLIGDGPARALLMSGELLTGIQAHRLGLATYRATSNQSLHDEVETFCNKLASSGHHALRVTKAWLNQLDGSLDDARFEAPAQASAKLADAHEARTLLAQWNRT